jgi:ADP-ribose pyrophosphatase YjhB (NUDIX family)
MVIQNKVLRWFAQRVWRWQRSVTLGVRGVVIDAQGRVLLVRHGYVPGWHFPGGGVDPGEAIGAALARELLEEAGMTIEQPPQLFGLYTNFAAFPGDHIACLVVRSFRRGPSPKPSFEIREHGFFARDALPEGTTAATHRRLAEIFDAVEPSPLW